MIKIWDTTLRDGEQAPNYHLDMEEKVKVAKLLEELGVDTIEAGFPANHDHEFEAVKSIASEVNSCEIAAFSRATKEDIDIAAEALESAKKPVLLTFTPASSRKLEMHGWTLEEGIEKAVKAVDYCKRKYPHIEISYGAEFATSADGEYLKNLYQSVVDAGVSRIVVADTDGIMSYKDFGRIVKYVKLRVKGDYLISVHTHNDRGLAVANSLEAVNNGADEIQVTALGIGERSGNACLEQVAMNLKYTPINIDYSHMHKIISAIADVFGYCINPNKPIVGGNVGVTGAGLHKWQKLYHWVADELGLKKMLFPGPHLGNREGDNEAIEYCLEEVNRNIERLKLYREKLS